MDTLVEGHYESLNNLKFSQDNFVSSNSMNNIPQNVAFRTTHCFVDSQVPSIDPNHSTSDQRQFILSHQDSVDNITQNIAFRANDSVSSQIITLSDSDQYVDLEPRDVGGVPDFPDACLKYMGDILMDEDFCDQLPATIENYRALQATEKSLYDALGETYSHPPSRDQSHDFVVRNGGYAKAPADDDFGRNFVKFEGNGYCPYETSVETNLVLHHIPDQFGLCPYVIGNSDPSSMSKSRSARSSDNSSDDAYGRSVDPPVSTILCPDSTNLGNFDRIGEAILNLGGNGSINHGMACELRKMGDMVSESRGTKHHHRDDDGGDYGDLRSSKHLAPNLEEDVNIETYDDLFLHKDDQNIIHPCIDGSSNVETSANSSPTKILKGCNKGRPRRGDKKKSDGQVETIDMRLLLTQCAQAMAGFDLRTANELLNQIRKHSTPYGDSIQRVAHYFANGLEARLSGTAGSELVPTRGGLQIPLAYFLKAYRACVSVVPFKRITIFLANKTIANLARNASRIHIIDFGINYGIQWPCFIQNLSERAIGPPKLRITAVDYPERGYQPASRIEATGRQLSKYCERFGVPFEYHPIAKRWEDVCTDDLKIDRDELLVVNCVWGAVRLFDETVDESSPRDTFLSFVRKLKPDLFTHAIINGSLNTPFFITRFREALLYFSASFDIFEETTPREDSERLFFEREVLGKSVLNILACEAAERVERPEIYKQWQVRHLRAGFKQQGFDQELVKEAKAMLRGNYRRNFFVDEDAQWVLLGWKGKIMFAISCWRSAY